MNGIFDLLLSAQLLISVQVPSGTPLHIRLTRPVGSFASRQGSAVHAVLIAPVVAGNKTIIPAGSLVSGRVRSVKKVGFGIVHETAALNLDFNQLTLPDGRILPLPAVVEQVDNGRERIGKDGTIRGIRSTASLCYRTSGYIRTALEWEIHAELAEWFIKTLVVQVPEPEIYYPAGVELTLKLTRPMRVIAAEGTREGPSRLNLMEKDDLEALAEDLPLRAFAPSSRPSDLVNVLFAGSREQLVKAFSAAGWMRPHRVSVRSDILNIRAVAEGHGYRRAPMSSLLVNNAQPDMSWEKGFNDPSKRDHIRIWRQPETWHGREIWIGAATRDVDFAYFRHGQRLTHRVERNIDREREKVTADLAFTSCADSIDHLERTLAPHITENATGDTMSTDGKLAVVVLNGCSAPRTGRDDDGHELPIHGGRMERLVRREILSMRSDLLRTNVYYRCYEGARWLVEAAVRRRRTHTVPTARPAPRVRIQRASTASQPPAS